MPVNDPKTPKPEDILNELFYSLFKPTTTNSTSTKPTTPAVDPIAEVNRLLKRAEASDSVNQTAELLQIADRHLKMIELALAYQK